MEQGFHPQIQTYWLKARLVPLSYRSHLCLSLSVRTLGSSNPAPSLQARKHTFLAQTEYLCSCMPPRAQSGWPHRFFLSSPLLLVSAILVGSEQRKTKVDTNPTSTQQTLRSLGLTVKTFYRPYNNNFLAVRTGWVETGSPVAQAAVVLCVPKDDL